MANFRHFKMLSTTVVLAVVWCVSVLLLTRTIPVSLQFEETNGSVAAVSSRSDGVESTSPAQVIPQDGRLSLPVTRSARTFHFVLSPAQGSRAAFRLKSVGVFGVPVFSAGQLCNYVMRKKLYTKYPQAGEPLVLNVSQGEVLDFPNVFPFILRVTRLGLLVCAWFPLALAALLCAGPVVMTIVRKCLAANCACGSGWYWLGVVPLLMLTLPPPVTAASPGLDASWVWLFNRFAFTQAIGRDFVFTYGPLGFLINPQLTLQNELVGIAVNVAFTLLFAWMLHLVRRNGHTLQERLPAYFLPLVWVFPWPNGMEWKWCVVSIMTGGLAFLHPHLRPRERAIAVVAAALAMVLQSFVKFSSLISLSAQSIFLVLFALLSRGRQARRDAVLFAVTLMCAFLGGSVFLFPSGAAFLSWIRGSCEISQGYNLYMIAEKSVVEYGMTLLVLGGWGVGLMSAARDRRTARRAVALFAPLLFFAVKYAIVRQSSVPLAYCSAFLTILSLAFFEVRLKPICLSVCFLLFMAQGVGFLFCGQSSVSSLSVQNLRDTLSPQTALARVRVHQEELFRRASLPQAWLDVLGKSSVMIVGTEMGPAMSGNLNFIPFPATQLYSAYTSYLDRLCADALVGENAPDFLLVPSDPWSIDSRNVYLDNPRIWANVRARYVYQDMNAEYVLLRKRDAFVPMTSDGPCFSAERSRIGKLVAGFLRTSRTMARFVYSDATEYQCSFNPEVLNGTLIPSFIPRTKDEVRAFFQPERPHPCIKAWSLTSSYFILRGECPSCSAVSSIPGEKGLNAYKKLFNRAREKTIIDLDDDVIEFPIFLCMC